MRFYNLSERQFPSQNNTCGAITPPLAPPGCNWSKTRKLLVRLTYVPELVKQITASSTFASLGIYIQVFISRYFYPRISTHICTHFWVALRQPLGCSCKLLLAYPFPDCSRGARKPP